MVDQNPSRFEFSHALRMFPIFVWRAECEPHIHRSISASIASKLGDLRRPLPVLEPDQSWRSDPTLHRRDEFRELVSCIEEAAAAVLAYLRIACEAFEITACWARVSAPGARPWHAQSSEAPELQPPRRHRLPPVRRSLPLYPICAPVSIVFPGRALDLGLSNRMKWRAGGP